MAAENRQSEVGDGETGGEGGRKGCGVWEAGCGFIKEIEKTEVSDSESEDCGWNKLDFSGSGDARRVGEDQKDWCEDEGKRGAVGRLSERAEEHYGTGRNRCGTQLGAEGCQGSRVQRNPHGAEVYDADRKTLNLIRGLRYRFLLSVLMRSGTTLGPLGLRKSACRLS